MSKIAIVFWSGTGNTAQMAQAISDGASVAGAEAVLINASDFKPEDLDKYDAIALGCPAMGAEVLEETEFQPMFDSIESSLSGRKVALFGSYGWGDGEWMRQWEDQVKADGALLVGEPVIAHEAPDENALYECRALGRSLI
jgi:flavodoxin short chain